MMYNYMSMNPTQVLEGVKQYGPAVGGKKMMDWEYQHGKESIERGIYVTYWCELKKTECGRIGSSSKCFCGHLFKSHRLKFGKKMDTGCESCPCKSYMFVPTRPEECGMFWLPRRKDFKVYEWRAKCKCKHSHEEHMPNRPYKCNSCHNCYGFIGDFACISCDQAWSDHEVLYESEDERKMAKKAIGESFLPLSDNTELQDLVFNPSEEQAQKSIAYTRPNPNNVKNALPKSTTTTVSVPKSKVSVVTSKPTTLAIEQEQQEPVFSSKPKSPEVDMPVYMEETKTQPTVTKSKPNSGIPEKKVQKELISKQPVIQKSTVPSTSTNTSSKTVVKTKTTGPSTGMKSGAYNY